MEYLQTLLDNSEIPIITAFLLGLLTAVSPCPLATNITAIGFISKDINNRNRIFTNGILYTLGRVRHYRRQNKWRRTLRQSYQDDRGLRKAQVHDGRQGVQTGRQARAVHSCGNCARVSPDAQRYEDARRAYGGLLMRA